MLNKSWFQNSLEKRGQIALGTASLTSKDPLLPDAEAIIVAAIKSGIQIIDTASNYEDGLAEEILGSLAKQFPNDVLIFTKAGQKTEREMTQKEDPDNNPVPHHWSFDLPSIEASIIRSQKRLRRDYIDCVFLHNPEDILSDETDVLPAIIPAIDYLERLSTDRVIGCWGISSWSGFFSEHQNPAPIQLSKLMSHLETYKKNNHFLAIQFPFGQWNQNAIRQKSQYSKNDKSLETLFITAKHYGISCLVNAPFNGGHSIPCSGINNNPYITPAQKELLYFHKLVPSSTRVIGMTSQRSIDEIGLLQEYIYND